jgi:hypothetical protein
MRAEVVVDGAIPVAPFDPKRWKDIAGAVGVPALETHSLIPGAQNIVVARVLPGTDAAFSSFLKANRHRFGQSRCGSAAAGKEPFMCDYSLHAVQSRPAKVGEKLVSTSFRLASTCGFAARDNREIAVCLLPGTELAFDEDVKFYHRWIWAKKTGFRVARFCQVDTHLNDRHHDAIELPDGKVVLVTLLTPGQHATVLQLPISRESADRLRSPAPRPETAS